MGSGNSRQNSEDDFFHQTCFLPAEHQKHLFTTKEFWLYLCKDGPYLSHHGIVVKDPTGELQDVKFHIIPDKNQLMSLKGADIQAHISVFKHNANETLTLKTIIKDTSLYNLTGAASKAFQKMGPSYSLVVNNCQDFCMKFLEELKIDTYTTDMHFTFAAIGVAIIATVIMQFLRR